MSEIDKLEQEIPPLTLEKITLKEFEELKSTIPAELMAKLSDEEKYLFSTVSQLKEQNKFLAMNQIRHNEALRALIANYHMGFTWRTIFTTKWGMLVGILSLLISGLIIEATKRIFVWGFGKTP